MIQNHYCFINFAGAYFCQISLKLLHLLYNSVREVDSHIWMLQESLREPIQ